MLHLVLGRKMYLNDRHFVKELQFGSFSETEFYVA